jgi:uncharacterized protein (DUF2062 family)
MTPVTAVDPSAADGARAGFWRRRVLGPLRAQLVQGVSPDRLALTLGLGTACSLLPFLGFTALLNLGVGLALRLNQPILQTLNQLLGPLQLALILVHVRIGEWIWGASGPRFSLTEMLQVFREASLGEFLARFGWAGVHALTAWLVLSPFVATAVTFATRPLLRRLAGRASS